MKHIQHNKGFSLMEVVVVVAIFSIVTLVATNIFLLVTQAQHRNTISQKIQGDVRFAVEAIAREARFGTIDYACYDGATAACDPLVAELINLQNTRGETKVLAIRDTQGNRIRYSVFADVDGREKLHICFLNIATDSLNKCDYDPAGDWRDDWEVMTPQGVEIVRGAFHIHPFVNPFQFDEGDPLYLDDEQPSVTVVLRTQQQESSATPEQISIQTTVTSRVYAR